MINIKTYSSITKEFMTTLTVPEVRNVLAVPRYVPGSDKKTVKMVAELIAAINAKMEEGLFQEAERMIEGVQDVRNIPFKIEFAFQCERMV